MKNFLVSLLLLMFISIQVMPQSATSTITRWSAKESEGAFKVEMDFTADSLGNLVSQPFSVPKYDLDYTAFGTPIVFRFKTVSTYGSPGCTIFLQGIYSSATDTIALDTIRYQAVSAQLETDSTGILSMNGKWAPSYKIFIRNTSANDINSGRLSILFPMKPKYFR